jgi:hypothetical protein
MEVMGYALGWPLLVTAMQAIAAFIGGSTRV